MAAKKLKNILADKLRGEKLFLSKSDDEGFICRIEHQWQTVAKVVAEFEKEAPVLLWNPVKVQELAFDKDAIKGAWSSAVTVSSRDQHISFTP